MSNTTFSWKNYAKPTPKNLLRFSEFLQGTLLGISTIAMALEANHWIPMSLNVSIVIVNRVVMFFGSVVKDETESATAQFPSGDEVTVTKDVKDEKEP